MGLDGEEVEGHFVKDQSRSQAELLAQVEGSENKELAHRAREARIRAEEADAQGREKFYKLRTIWAFFLGGMSIMTTILVFVILFLTGLGYMNLSNYILGGLVALGVIDNGLNRFATAYLFSERESFFNPSRGQRKD